MRPRFARARTVMEPHTSMAELPRDGAPSPTQTPQPDVTAASAEQSLAQVSSLLHELESAVPAVSQAAYESRLVEVRLGIASTLFTALRHKHAPTAAHSLRVALGCSSWAFALGLDPTERDELEVAALLHDVGK